MIKPLQKAFRLIAFSGAILAATACVQTGYNYNTAQFSQIKAGESNLDDVNRILGAHPTNIYRSVDGSFTAMYSHKKSLIADAIYHNKELLLAFDNLGRYKYIVGGAGQNPESQHNTNNNNVPVANTSSGVDDNNSLQTNTIDEEVEVIVIERQDEPVTTITETITQEKTTPKTNNQTNGVHDKCSTDCSLNAPNTYPVYLKRSGSNVLKRYDIQE